MGPVTGFARHRNPTGGRVAATTWLAGASLLAALITGWSADRAWSSLVDYAPAPPAATAGRAAGPALSPRVVLVLVDGLGVDSAREVPALDAVSRRGAALTCAVSPPSLSRPGRATLLTGARPHVHGATTNFHPDRPAAAPSLLDGLSGARVWGSKLWPGLFPRGFGGGAHVTRVDIQHAEHRDKAEALFAAERAAVAEAVAALDRDLGFAVIDLLGVDSSSHDHGVGSPEQRDALRHVDAMLQALTPAVLERGGTLVVTADHGHVAEGGHGGDEPEVTAVPLVLAGAGVRAGARGACAHLDVAPTLAVLLGVAAPAAAEGRVLWEALVSAAPTALAARAAGPITNGGPRAGRLATALVAAVLAVGLCALGVSVAGPLPSAGFGLAAAASAALLLQWSGLRLSLSGINDEALLVPYFSRVLAFATLAGLCGAVAAAALARDRARLVVVAGAVAVSQGSLLLFAAVVHGRHSLLVDGPIEAIGVVFFAFAALVASLGLAPLPLVAAIAHAVRGRVR
ncbi:MAG: alkaline phosphatase family protein [Vicinamibacteria bacterium]|nr:alkaline phosphatase family protein [Vicinamibacteria bacterium]